MKHECINIWIRYHMNILIHEYMKHEYMSTYETWVRHEYRSTSIWDMSMAWDKANKVYYSPLSSCPNIEHLSETFMPAIISEECLNFLNLNKDWRIIVYGQTDNFLLSKSMFITKLKVKIRPCPVNIFSSADLNYKIINIYLVWNIFWTC